MEEKITPFSYANYVLTRKGLPKDHEFKSYSAFLLNRSLAQHLDALLYANQMNQYPGLDVDVQFQYFLNTIRPMKRKFQSWNKASSVKDLDIVKEYFGYSDEKAKDALTILSNEDIALIKEKLDKGGVKK